MRVTYTIFIIFGLLLMPIVILGIGWEADNHFGREKWEAVLNDLRAHEDPTDFQTLIPPNIDPNTNLGALELFKLERSKDESSRQQVQLRAALKDIDDRTVILRLGSYIKGNHYNQSELAGFLSGQFHQSFPHQVPPASLLDQFDQLCPVLAELRDAAAMRNNCRFERDYTTQPPYNRELGDITELILLSRALDLHAIAALRSGQPSVALQDIKACLILDAGARKEPMLISGLVGLGVFAIQEQAIWEGLEDHAWNDAQLADLQRRLSEVDFVVNGQLCLRGEALGYTAPIIDYLKKNQYSATELFLGLIRDDEQNKLPMRILWRICPPGEFDRARADVVDLEMRSARETVDLKARKVFSKKCEALIAEAKAFPRFPPPMMLAGISMGPIAGAQFKFWQGQVKADETRIACMIECYRLAHGSLPPSLDLLAPYAGTAGVPKDIFTAAPYHYQVRADGTFLLYSVGQNETDDGGEIVHMSDNPKAIDYEKGDWVWPQPGHPGT